MSAKIITLPVIRIERYDDQVQCPVCGEEVSAEIGDEIECDMDKDGKSCPVCRVTFYQG